MRTKQADHVTIDMTTASRETRQNTGTETLQNTGTETLQNTEAETLQNTETETLQNTEAETRQNTEAETLQGSAAVILAAGAGSRFRGQRHKLLTEVAGVPLVRRAVDAAHRAGFTETIVVMGAVDLIGVLPDDVTVIRNDDWKHGQATSLTAAVGYAGSRGYRAVVFGLGDQPGVPTSAWEAVGGCGHDLAVADFNGIRCPPVRIGAALWIHLPLIGDQGARTLLRQRSELVRAIPCEGSPDDVDTLQDLHKWNRRMQTRTRES